MIQSFLKPHPFAFAALMSSVMALIKLYFLHDTVVEYPYLFSLWATVASALYGGFWPGVFSLFLSVLFSLFFFLPPYESLLIERNSIFPLAVFIFEAVVLAFVINRKIVVERRILDINKHLEEKVHQRTRAVRKYNQELQRSNKELEEFAYVASHDLQEPLRKIQAFGDLLAEEHGSQLKGDAKLYLERMLSSAGRMRGLIDDLLRYSRLTTAKREYRKTDLNKVVQLALQDLEVRIVEYDANIEVNQLPTLEADSQQLQQLFQNLLSNALKFHRKGVKPLIRISSNKIIREKNGKERAFAEISVRDNGVGFDTKYLDRIFQLFERLHGRSEYEGTGIGLALCKKIVTQHGGTITAQSKQNEGTTFIITLPYQQKRKGPSWIPRMKS